MVTTALLALVAAPSPAGADGADGVQWWQTPDAAELTIDLNAYRRSIGLATLPADGVLSYLAEAHASTLAQQGALFHEDLPLVARVTGCPALAENVGRAPTVWAAHQALATHAEHQANMVGAWRLVGIGVATGRGQKWVVQLFCTW